MIINLPDNLSVLQISPFAGDVLTESDAPNAMWHILGQARDGTELFRSTGMRCPNIAGLELHRITTRAIISSLVYHDAFDRTNAAEAESFGDRLAEVMWNAISRAGDISDHPEEYARLADGHPICELRTGFLEAAGIF